MTEEQIVTVTNEVFEELFEIERERLLPEAHLFKDLGLDSLDVVDLAVEVQYKFGVRIRDDERIRSIETLGQVYYFIGLLAGEGTWSSKE